MWLLALALAGCNRHEPAKDTTASLGQKSDESHASARDQFCLMALEVELATPASRRMSAIKIDSHWANGSLGGISELVIPAKSNQKRCADFAPSRRVGVALAIDYAARDQNPELVRPDAAGEDAELLISLIAHVERAGSQGSVDVAKHTLEVAAPMPPDRSEVLVSRIVSRLTRAASQTTRSALGKLWARDQNLDTLRQTAQSQLTWKQSAAIVELGERNDQKS
ncbi:MAG TPA: hypothetical protein DCQ06_11870, partial [Myxococcales bacterium]|nr:hypothetical protein [Myxococcales bacterium]